MLKAYLWGIFTGREQGRQAAPAATEAKQVATPVLSPGLAWHAKGEAFRRAAASDLSFPRS